MTLDEAIKHAEEVAKEKLYEYQECIAVHDMEDAMDCEKCGEEHRQLAEWLKELKQLREQEPVLDKIRADIEELIEWHDCPVELDGGNDLYYCEACKRAIEIIDKYKES